MATNSHIHDKPFNHFESSSELTIFVFLKPSLPNFKIYVKFLKTGAHYIEAKTYLVNWLSILNSCKIYAFHYKRPNANPILYLSVCSIEKIDVYRAIL